MFESNHKSIALNTLYVLQSSKEISSAYVPKHNLKIKSVKFLLMIADSKNDIILL